MVKKLENPFKGLQPYRQEDAGTLFGRDRDLLLIQDRIFSTKTTLLFAGSGVGKTSFLNAKVIPETDQRYVICYHNQWSGDNPLHAVKIVLASGLAEKEPELKRDELLSFVENSEYRLKDFFNRYRSDRCIIILDQFEEIFQYHAYEPYFNQFLDELCEVINADDLQVRIVFSMREEFLGELSIFDNRIPDLFNNYYRLKYLDKSQAEGIIVRTCALAGVEPDTNKLQMLLNDLSKMEKEVSIFDEEAKQKSDSKPREIKLDFLIPPYLQIVCHETWDEPIKFKQDVKPDIFVFLANYEANGAQKTLGKFCHEKLSTLTTKEKDLTAKAFDFLVTKRGAKMAYDVESLAKHMRTNIKYLADTLAKLSKPDTRILRESYRPDKSRWFELYHDMFSPIIYEWKESYQEKRRRISRIKWAGIAIAVTAIVLTSGAWIANYLQVQSTIYSLQQTLDNVKQHKISAKDFRNQFIQARSDAPKSPEISKIKNEFDLWRIGVLNDSVLQWKTPFLKRADSLLQLLNLEYPQETMLISGLEDTLRQRNIREIEKKYYTLVNNSRSSENTLKDADTLLNSAFIAFDKDVRITELQSDLAKRRNDLVAQAQLALEAKRQRNLARNQLLAAIQVKEPANMTLKAYSSTRETQDKIVLKNSKILQSVRVFLNETEMSSQAIGKETFKRGTVTIPRAAQKVIVTVRAIDK